MAADPYIGLKAGNTSQRIVAGHTIHITATRELGLNTGRRRYMVECLTCKRTLHEATTGPDSHITQHTGVSL